MDSKSKALKIAEILNDKKAEDIKIIRIDEVSSLADYFVITEGNNNTHTRTLFEEVDEKLEGVIRKEKNNEWYVLDYGDVIVHIFYKKTREFYNMERLWKDGEFLEFDLK
ncbi:MAG: ribosome silencing factor [Ruminococcus sp.]|jgi:ribosome-associated protein|nr:ribosome silencing factor [Ruminococcus sp.]